MKHQYLMSKKNFSNHEQNKTNVAKKKEKKKKKTFFTFTDKN